MAKKLKPTELEQCKQVLRDLIDGCGTITISGTLDADSVLKMRKVLKLFAALDEAKKLIGDE